MVDESLEHGLFNCPEYFEEHIEIIQTCEQLGSKFDVRNFFDQKRATAIRRAVGFQDN